MGWSSWNHFHLDIDEKMIQEQANAMISSGLYEVGYQFINIDDGYFGGRDSSGKLFSHPTKFPSGMKALADIIAKD
jgi:alpha-galactosidase